MEVTRAGAGLESQRAYWMASKETAKRKQAKSEVDFCLNMAWVRW